MNHTRAYSLVKSFVDSLAREGGYSYISYRLRLCRRRGLCRSAEGIQQRGVPESLSHHLVRLGMV